MPPVSSLSAIALTPRSLKISASTPITRTHLLALYKEQLRVAHSFSSYNFKHYFIRRTREKFRNELPALLDSSFSQGAPSTSSASTSSSASAPSSSSSKTQSGAGAGASQEERLRAWYTENLEELGVIARSAVVNRMYEAPKLVVEGRGNVAVVGGGGAGMEAS